MTALKGSVLARVLVLATLLALAALPLVASSAEAHNELESSTPAAGGHVKQLPEHVKMVFSEELEAGDLTVKLHGKSLPVHLDPGHPDSARVDLSGVKPAATVALAWTAIDSHDGHITEGVLTFHVTSALASGRASPTTTAPADPRSLTPLSVAAHVVGYLAMAVLLGGLLFVSFLWPEGALDARTRNLLAGSVGAGLLAALAMIFVEVHRAGANGRNEALVADYGRAATAMAMLWLLAAVIVVGLLQGGPATAKALAWRVGAVVVAIGLIRTTGMTAHVTQGDSHWLGVTVDFLHLGGVSAWLGGLAVMAVGVLPRRQLTELAEIVPRYSRVAMVSVLMIIASGLVMLYQIGLPIEGFWTTHYARIFLVKMGLLGVVLVAALMSKRWVDGSLAYAVSTGKQSTVRSFVRSVSAEAVLAIAVLSAASVLVTSSPGS